MSYKVCPICGTLAHPNATMCTTCGTTLTNVDLVKREAKPAAAAQYDRRYGETDLLEGELGSRGRVYLFSAALVVAVLLCGAGVFFVGMRFLGSTEPTPTPTVVSRSSDGTEMPILVVTNTARPTLLLPTVTPAPPSPTFTATEGPCTRQVQSGDDLITLAYSCGHRSLDIMPLILELNGMSAPEELQVGQSLLIPWPTPTGEPAAPTVEGEESGSASTDSLAASVDGTPNPDSEAPIESEALAALATGTRTPLPSPTLLPGVTWHIVAPNENMIAIAYTYNTNAETLSQLNPEIPFSQCDFKYDTGGETCTVLLQSGQRIRVPAPTPTPTLSPTLSGSETATFTPTPTFNAPNALSPGNRAQFGRDELITLRWVASGLLNEGEAYRITVEDLTISTVFSADTSELFYIIPTAWQGQDARRHEYRWSISVIRLDDSENPTFTTEARLFTWDGRGES